VRPDVTGEEMHAWIVAISIRWGRGAVSEEGLDQRFPGGDIDVAEDYFGAQGVEVSDCGGADAAGAAGEDYNFVFEIGCGCGGGIEECHCVFPFGLCSGWDGKDGNDMKGE
jgi:hypothetical protein